MLMTLGCILFAVSLAACSSTSARVDMGNGSAVEIGVGEVHPHKSVPHKGGPPPHAPAHGYRAKHTYHYYPDSQVYYDTGRGLYFYIEGGSWRVSATLPSSLHVGLGSHVAIDMYTDEPYLYSKDHKKKYPPGQMKKYPPGQMKKKKK